MLETAAVGIDPLAGAWLEEAPPEDVAPPVSVVEVEAVLDDGTGTAVVDEEVVVLDDGLACTSTTKKS